MTQMIDQLQRIVPAALEGSVVRTVGLTAAAADFPAPVGALVEIQRQGESPVKAQVIGFQDSLTLLYPLAEMTGVRRGNRVRLVRSARWLRTGQGLLGRVVDAYGRCIDGKPQPVLPNRVEISRRPPNAFERPRISTPLSTGVRVIDGLLACGKGQRLGIFAGSGVGKSTVLGMMARYTAADINVIGLIGERGREVNEFIERDLGPDGLARSVVVVATSDEPALARVQAALTATAIAESFRDAGNDILLLMDSLTRFAMAQREIGLAAGEPPTTRGYPPSVFATLPQLVERAGRSTAGSITGFYSVLVEGDDPQEPISDTVRGLLDGHVWLSRKLASKGHYPAVDVLQSISRLLTDITTRGQQDGVQLVRELLAAYRDHEDLISIGAYRRGANKMVDLAIEFQDELNQFLRQRVEEQVTLEVAVTALQQLQAKIVHRAANPTLQPAMQQANIAGGIPTIGG